MPVTPPRFWNGYRWVDLDAGGDRGAPLPHELEPRDKPQRARPLEVLSHGAALVGISDSSADLKPESSDHVAAAEHAFNARPSVGEGDKVQVRIMPDDKVVEMTAGPVVHVGPPKTPKT